MSNRFFSVVSYSVRKERDFLSGEDRLPVDREAIQSHLVKHMEMVESETRIDAKRFMDKLERFDGMRKYPRPKQLDHYSVMLSDLLREDPFCLLPVDVRNLRVEPSVSAETFEGFPYWPVQYKGPFSNCLETSIPQNQFGGYPIKPEEMVYTGADPSWPPARYAWSQPKLGRLELVSCISKSVPGENQIGGFGYTVASAQLAAVYPLLGSEARDVAVKAQPFFSGLLGFGSGPDSWEASGYMVSVGLSVSALSSKTSESNTIVVDSNFAGVIGWPLINKVQYWPTPYAKLRVVEPDLLFMSLIVSAVVFQEQGGMGYALVDIDGLTSPPGKSKYWPSGAVSLPYFQVSSCPVP
jgi:hypothetical protein